MIALSYDKNQSGILCDNKLPIEVIVTLCNLCIVLIIIIGGNTKMTPVLTEHSVSAKVHTEWFTLNKMKND